MSGSEMPEMFALQLSYLKICLISAAVKFDIVEHLFEKQRTAQELAEITKTDASSLLRLLRGLVSLNVLNLEPNNTYSVTKFGETLNSNCEFNLKDMAKIHSDDCYIAAQHLPRSIETGTSMFQFSHGTTFYNFVKENREKAQLFSDALNGLCKHQAKQLSLIYNFSQFNKIADVGGSKGALITEIMRENKNVIGILFDQKEFIEIAEETLKYEFGDRIAAIAGDMFESVPDDCDCYIVKGVLFNWKDENVLRILSNIRDKMKPNAKLLVIEPSMESKYCIPYDILMMSVSEGKVRTADEYKQLFDKVGLKLDRIIPVPNSAEIIHEITLN